MNRFASLRIGVLALALLPVAASAGESPPQCTVTFHLDQEVDLGALQFHADYSKADGYFGGSGISVDCTDLAGSTKVVSNDLDFDRVLHTARATLSTLTGPADVLKCRFEAISTPSPGDFSVVVDDAAPPETNGDDTGVCGGPDSGLTPPLARDALVALRTAVDIPTDCSLCECDVDDSGSVTTADALRILKNSVHLTYPMTCPACEPESTTTTIESSTTTSLDGPTTTTLLEIGPSTVIDDNPVVTISVTVSCPECSNGVVDEGEDCDDGNTDETDACLSDCTWNPCLTCDGEVCTPNEKASCDDGVFCNGQDYCAGGECVEHAGDPCEKSGECGGACDEKSATCTAGVLEGEPCVGDENPCTDDVCDGKGTCGVPNQAPCDDGVFCNGDDVCSDGECTHAGDPCPANDCSACEEESDNCFLPAGTACTSDDDRCTDDLCDGSGACEHPPIPLAPVCNWAVVAGSDTREGHARSRVYAEIGGSVCADTGDVGDEAKLVAPGSWALLADSGTALTVRPSAEVLDGRVVTGGGCLTGRRNALIFGTSLKGPICCADGDIPLPGGNPLNVINACGLDPLLADCADAKAQVPDDIALLDGLVATQTFGNLSVPPASSLTITAGPGLNVIDINRVRINRNATVVIDAQGNADAVIILRLISGGIRASRGGTIALAGGAVPKNLLFYAQDDNCIFSKGVVGAGTLFCPEGAVRLRLDTQWTGSVAGGAAVDIGWDAGLVHVPFLGLAQ